MNESTARLVAVLREQRPSPMMADLIARAEREEFHDFDGIHVLPKTVLVEHLKADHRHALAKRAARGEFDATTAEAQAWAQSPDGKETLAMVGTPAGRQALADALGQLGPDAAREIYPTEEV